MRSFALLRLQSSGKALTYVKYQVEIRMRRWIDLGLMNQISAVLAESGVQVMSGRLATGTFFTTALRAIRVFLHFLH